MRDPAVQQPHLGPEAIGVLARIVAASDTGLGQDDIEPFLLVRLLRCGYVRRREPHAQVFIATPAGIRRSRLETISARRQQEELDRREIIRGRLQATVARLERDHPAAPPPPTPRDDGLPEIHQRRRPALPEQPVPGMGEGSGATARDRGLRIVRDDRAAAMRDAARTTPEAALALIRETARPERDREPPAAMAGEVLPPDGEMPVVPLAGLPPKHEPGATATGEASAAARQNGVDVPVDVSGDSDAVALGKAVVPPDAHVLKEAAPRHDAVPEAAPGAEARRGWKRASVVAAVAAVALLTGDPLFRCLLSLTEAPSHASTAHAPMPALRSLPVSTAASYAPVAASLPAPVVAAMTVAAPTPAAASRVTETPPSAHAMTNATTRPVEEATLPASASTVVATSAVAARPSAQAGPAMEARPVVPAPIAGSAPIAAAAAAVATTPAPVTTAAGAQPFGLALSARATPAIGAADRAGAAAGTPNAQGGAETTAGPDATAPAIGQDTYGPPADDAAARMLERLRNEKRADAVAVERLNALSLRAARAGTTYLPRVVKTGIRSAQETAESRRQTKLVSQR